MSEITLEEMKLRREQSAERSLNTELNMLRKKRLNQEYKIELVEKMKEKLMRQKMYKMNNIEKANNSYQAGIQMRDQFYRTSFVASQAYQPI